jgi:hypothetical protein
MPKAKVFIFAPADTASHSELQAAGCDLVLGTGMTGGMERSYVRLETEVLQAA